MHSVPHTHIGQVELCYEQLCTRVTTSEAGAAVLGGLAFAGLFALAIAALSE